MSEERTIYVIRHGSTELNEKHQIRGHANVPLSALGREEVRKLGAKLASSNIGIIFHSDLDRARDTADAVAQATGAKNFSSKLLRPWDLGDYTGRASSRCIRASLVRLRTLRGGRSRAARASIRSWIARAGASFTRW